MKEGWANGAVDSDNRSNLEDIDERAVWYFECSVGLEFADNASESSS